MIKIRVTFSLSFLLLRHLPISMANRYACANILHILTKKNSFASWIGRGRNSTHLTCNCHKWCRIAFLGKPNTTTALETNGNTLKFKITHEVQPAYKSCACTQVPERKTLVLYNCYSVRSKIIIIMSYKHHVQFKIMSYCCWAVYSEPMSYTQRLCT